MKTRFLNICMIALAISFASCEKAPQKGPDQPTVVPPAEGFVTIVNADGSVLVESDYAQNTVNNLINAIKDYAGYDNLAVQEVNPETGEISETGETVKCSNVFYLQRGGMYFIEGKGKINSQKEIKDEEGNVIETIMVDNVIIKAEDGNGALPVIQPIADSQGSTSADMLIFETSAELENIHFNAIDPMTQSIMQRMLRIEAKKGKISLRNCFADYCANSFVRIEAKDTQIELVNSTFRNLAKGFSSNGRLVDTRGNNVKSLIINNCTVYNMVGRIIRYDKCTIDRMEMTHNTFYNCGYGLQFEKPVVLTVEDNIFADNGWYTSSDAYKRVTDGGDFELDENGKKILNNDFWDITGYTKENEDGTVTITGDLTNVKVSIRNNNVFTSKTLSDLYVKYAETAHAPVLELGPAEQALVDNGAVKFEKNISEVLTFDNAPELPVKFLEERLSTLTKEETIKEYFYSDGEYSFSYPSSAQSSTAATDGGKLGVR